MSGWIDVSRPLSDATAVWPGDTPWSFGLTSSMAAGAPANVGRVHGTTHAGTHADAPLHVDPAGDPVDRLPIDAFVGPAWLVDLTGRGAAVGGTGATVAPGAAIAAEELAAAVPAGAERILLRTGCDWSGGFPATFRGLSVEASRWCVARGLRLVGTDAPSVDPFDADTLPAHHALVAGGVVILESLDLAVHPPGRYELVALPLRLAGADASPVRAAIRPMA
jgi:arylformamidase